MFREWLTAVNSISSLHQLLMRRPFCGVEAGGSQPFCECSCSSPMCTLQRGRPAAEWELVQGSKKKSGFLKPQIGNVTFWVFGIFVSSNPEKSSICVQEFPVCPWLPSRALRFLCVLSRCRNLLIVTHRGGRSLGWGQSVFFLFPPNQSVVVLV